MSGKQITKYFLMGVIILIIVFDVWVINQHGRSSSVSWFIIADLKEEWPLINDGFWFVLGHLFWRMKKPKDVKEDV